MTRKEWTEVLRRAEREIQHHYCRDAPSQSWRFGSIEPDGRMSTVYSYMVTWSPGTLAVSGDLGEMVITHYHAMPTALKAAQWMHGSSFDYIISKSDAEKKYDAEATAAFIIQQANEGALQSFRLLLAEQREFRKALIRSDFDERPDLAEYPATPQFQPFIQDSATRRTQSWWPCIKGRQCEPPEGWDLWFRLGYEVADWVNAEEGLFTAAGRREVKRSLASRLEDGGHAGAELCRSIGFDDYYGSYDYDAGCMYKFAALQQWAAHVVGEHERAVQARGTVAA